MKTYKAFKDSISYFKNFNSLQEAELYFYENLDNTYSVIIAPDNEQISDFNPTPEQRLPIDIDFGNELINQFLLDNREIGNISLQDSINLLNKFNDIEKLSRLGAIKDVQLLMQNVVTDNIFTQIRKDKYLQMINNYLNSFN